MDAKKKKIIMGFGFAILMIVSIVIFVLSILLKDKVAKYITMFFSMVTPASLVGMALKWIMGKIQHKQHLKELNAWKETHGIKECKVEILKKKIEVADVPYFEVGQYKFYRDEKKRVMVMVWDKNVDDDNKNVLEQQRAISEYIGHLHTEKKTSGIIT